MPTIIDSLIVTLGMDTTKYEDGQKRAEKAIEKIEKTLDESTKKMNENSKVLANGIVKVRNELLTLLAVFTAASGLKDFGAKTMSNAAGLKLLSDNLDMSAKKLQAFQRANELAGGSKEGILDQLKQSSTSVARWKMGLGGDDEAIQWFARYGGSVRTGMQSGEEFLFERADIVARILKAKGPQAAALAASQMGIGDDSFNLAKTGGTGIRSAVAAQAANSALTDKDAANALEARQNLKQLGNEFEDVGITLLSKFKPALEAAVKVLERFAGWLKSEDPTHHNGWSATNNFVDGISALLGDPDAKARIAKDKADMDWKPTSLTDLDEFARQADPTGFLLKIKNRGERSGASAVSKKGAVGVMQLMPATWKQYARPGEAMTDPYDSINVAARYIADLRKRYRGNEAAMAAEYNGGVKQAQQVMAGQVPSYAETRQYLANMGFLRGGSSISEVHVGEITINTAATDAAGIAKSIKPALERYSFASQSNTGLN